MAKNLIIYYSRKGENYVNGSIRNLAKGNTEIVAEFIQKAVGGDLFEVDTVKPYSADYTTCTQEAQRELRAGARPELKKYLDSIDDYDNIFVCGPCWWGTFPMAVFSQLERLDFTGKKVMAVMTHEGSGLGSCERDLKKICKGASFGKGLAVHGADAEKSENTVAAWAKRQFDSDSALIGLYTKIGDFHNEERSYACNRRGTDRHGDRTVRQMRWQMWRNCL